MEIRLLGGQNMFDVIVIGAGPAGCSAARTLSAKGYRVLLAEKRPMPRYKSCSGQLIRKSLDLVRLYFGEAVPDSVTCAPAQNRGMILTDDRGNVFRFEQNGLNVWRSAFDQWLACKAAECGAQVLDGTAVLSCVPMDGKVAVTLKGKETCTLYANYVLNCEGAAGTLKRKLLKQEQESVLTYQTFNQGSIDLDHHYFYAYLQPELSEYDAWFNVKDNRLVLGVSVKNKQAAGHYYGRFLAYMRERHGLRIDKQEAVDKWLMPRIRPGCAIDYGVGRVLFAGEAAGFLNPMGEGISAGMESGYCAAAAVADHFDDPEAVHAAYRERTASLHGYMKRQWELTAGLAGTFREMKQGL